MSETKTEYLIDILPQNDNYVTIPISNVIAKTPDYDLLDTICSHCDEYFEYSAGPGRKPSYCSPKCRQAAFKGRRRAKQHDQDVIKSDDKIKLSLVGHKPVELSLPDALKLWHSLGQALDHKIMKLEDVDRLNGRGE